MILRRTPRPLHARWQKLRFTRALHAPAKNTRQASTTVSTAGAPGSDLRDGSAPIQRFPPSQPPSHKPADLRKTQLHRQYTSLLRSSPMMLIFQHNNLKAQEFAGIRRELSVALKAADATAAASAQNLGGEFSVQQAPRFQVISTGVFAAALRVVEHYHPEQAEESQHDMGNTKTGEVPAKAQHSHTSAHYLSTAAYRAAQLPRGKGNVIRKKPTTLDPLLSGPVAVLAFPSIAPHHLAMALRILAPTPGSSSPFSAPRRKDQPGLYEGGVQLGLQKLLLLGARVDGQPFDQDNVRRIGSLASRGGLEGLRAEVVTLLQSVGMGLAGSLDRVGISVWGTLEGRRQSLEEEQGGGKKEP